MLTYVDPHLPKARHRSGLAHTCCLDKHARGDPKTNYSLTQTSVDSQVCQKRDTAAVLLTIVVLTIKVVVKKIQHTYDYHKEQPRTTPRSTEL